MSASLRSWRVLAVFLVISTLAACSDTVGPERIIEGKIMYEQYCARCHGLDGSPVVGVDPPCDTDPSVAGCAGSFKDRTRMDRMSDEAFKGAVLGGKQAPRRATGVAPGKGMPGFPTQFTEATLMVLVAYVRGLSGSRGPHAPEPPTPTQPK